MKTTILLTTAIIGLSFTALSSCSVKGQNQSNSNIMETQTDSMSYALGILFANNLISQGITDFDSDMIAKGFADVAAEAATMTTDQANEIMRNIMQSREAAEGEANSAEGAAFLAENGKAEGVVTTDSGLQYRVDREGDGASPTASDNVTVNYHGTLICGTVFDSSYDRGQPASFGLSQVISGWTEGLQTMKIGGQTTFYIPSELAYGSRKTGEVIGANSTLIFKVELISID
ncbi:MAG: FKBP-type peptidyl-prolyl cis-trans isomerase [Flavobacteriales bacterium]|nr:FKBP-type peptidyl-prolyl cis-trans isomerase [Flavobacteriales bacterium]